MSLKLRLFLLLIFPVFASAQQCVHTWTYSQTSGSSFAITVAPASGNTLLVMLAAQDSGPPENATPTITGGQLGVKDNAVARVGTAPNISMDYWRWTAIGSGVTTVTFSNVDSLQISAIVCELPSTLIGASPLDVKDTTGASVTGPTAWSSGAVTTTNASDMVLGFACQTSVTTTLTAGTGFTLEATNVGHGYSCALVSKIVSSTGTYTPTGGNTHTGDEIGALGISYKVTAADYSITAPTLSGYVGAASGTWTLINNTGSTKTVAVSDAGHAGTVTSSCGTGTTPQNVVIPGSGSCTMTYTPVDVGARVLTFNDGGVNPSPNTFTYTSNACSLGISGPGSGNILAASSNFTVTLTGCTFDGSHTVTLTDQGELSTITPSVGSPGTSTINVTPTNGSSSFTATITPQLVGVRLFAVSSAYANWNSSASTTYTVAAVDASTFDCNSNNTCDWASSANWNCTGCSSHNTPRSGDKVTATGGRAICSTGVCAVGSAPSNNTTYDLVMTPSGGHDGTVECSNGAKLWMTTNCQFATPSAFGGSQTSFGVLKLDTGANVVIDNNQSASVAYRCVATTSYGWNKIMAGTSGDTCTFSSGSCPTVIRSNNVATGGPNPVLFDSNSLVNVITFDIEGTLLQGLGSASKAALEVGAEDNASGNSFAGAGLMTMKNSIMQATGNIQSPTGLSPQLSKMTFIGNQFRNDLVGWRNLDGIATTAFTSPCTISKNYFSGTASHGNNNDGNCGWTGNAFMAGHAPNASTSSQWTANTGNLFLINILAGGQGDYATSSPSFDHNMIFNIAAGASNHYFTPVCQNLSFTDNVFGTFDATQGEAHVLDKFAACAASVTASRNLSIPGPGGENSVQMGLWDPSGTASMMTQASDHNGMYGTTFPSWGVTLGHPGSPLNHPTNQVLTLYKDNIHWSPSAGIYNYAITCCQNNDSFAGASVSPANSMLASGVDYNSFLNPRASSQFAAGFDSNCNSGSTTLGLPYSTCNTDSVPGAHDFTADPKVIDNTRSLMTWASRLHGQAASLAGVQAALQSCQDVSFCIAEAWAWIRRGFQPMNLRFKGAAHDGSDMGPVKMLALPVAF